MMEQMEQMEQGRTTANGNTNAVVKKRKWCFTLNNWTEYELEELKKIFGTEKYYIGEEIGKEGTKHLQGYVEFKCPRHFTALQKINKKIHWEPCRNDKASIKYCQKDGIIHSNQFIKRPIKDPLENKEYYGWEKEILEILKTEPNGRAIYWYWEKTGNAGKSSFVKHLILNNPKIYTCVRAGAHKDLSKVICDFTDDDERDLHAILIDLPRCEEHISYRFIEEICDGMMLNPKYESKMCIFNPPHIIVFSNKPPDIEKMSLDRWIIKEIGTP